MSLSVACPGCQARYRLADGSEGKKVKCKKCGVPFTVQPAAAAEPETGIAPSSPAKVKQRAPVAEDPLGEDRPRRRAKDDEDDDGAEDRPRRRARANADDDDDRPRRRRHNAKQSSGSNVGLIIGGVVLGVLLLGGGVGYFFWSVGRTVTKVGKGFENVGKEFEKQVAIAAKRDRIEARFLDANAKIEVAGPGQEAVLGADGSFTHNDQLTNNDPVMAGKHYKWYFVAMEKGKGYQIDMASGQIDSFLRLLAPDGRVLAQDDDGGDELNARLFHQAAETGKHKVIATSFDLAEEATAKGPFTLTIRRDVPPPPGGFPPPNQGMPIVGMKSGTLPRISVVTQGTAVTLGADGAFTQSTTLGAGDPMGPGNGGLMANKAYKIFLLPMEQGKTYQIDMTHGNTGLDPFLFLLGPTGDTQALDDDGGGNLNSRIRYQARVTGVHRIVATSLVPGMQGPFTIAIRRQ